MSGGEEYSFRGYRLRLTWNETTLFWTPLEPIPDVEMFALKCWLDALVIHMQLALERPQPPEKFWVAEFDRRVRDIRDSWTKSR